MKAVRTKSNFLSSPSKNLGSQRSQAVLVSGKDSGFGDLPTPKDFDRFIPWLCLHFEVPRIVAVQRIDQEDHSPHSKRTSVRQGTKLKEDSVKREIQAIITSSYRPTYLVFNSDKQNAVPMWTYYNPQGLLEEVAFINCSFAIPRKIIRAISTCLPFHPAFHRLTIKGGGLVKSVLDEIGKLLPFSNITDICLDGNRVAEGNYYVILENLSALQNLSLRRCGIDDKMCEAIANTLRYGAPASKSLATLDLSSNIINDAGAQALGNMLRKNRTLLHLSLADNRVADQGAVHIFNSILSFPLTDNDVRDLKLRYLKYCFKKVKCEKETDTEKENKAPKSFKKIKNRDTGISHNKLSVMEQTEKMAKENVSDEFIDIFDNQNIILRDGQIYAVGNFKICYLNLAYNNLSFFSVKKLYESLKYQRTLSMPPKCKGLIKVVLDGNNIPKVCKELKYIQSYLDAAVSKSIASDLRHSNIKPVKKISKKKTL